MKTKKQASMSLLKNPITVLAAITIAILLGVLGSRGDVTVPANERTIYDWIGAVLIVCMPLGDMYLNMLRMTIYPILIAAIVSSIAGLVKTPEIGKYLSRMLAFFGLMLLLTAALGTFAGIIGRPGAGLSEEAKEILSRSIEKSEYKVDIEISLAEQETQVEKATIIDFIANIIPRNVFKSLVDELALQLVIFSILFGIASGVIGGERSEFIVTVFEGLFKAFQAIISWLMYLLPIGLIFLIAGQIASSQKFFEVLAAMIRFIVLFYIVGLLLLVINTIIIWRRSKEKLGLVLKELLDPIIIALATRSSFATLPSAMKALNQKLGFFENATKLYIPLGITLGRFGNILYFALATVFVSQLYGSPLTTGSIFIALIGSIFAGTATAGATGLTTLGLMSIVLEPMGLPIEAVLILFMTIDTIIDPLRTLLIVHSNMAVNALVAGKASKYERRIVIRDENEPITEQSPIDEIQAKGEIIVAIRSNDIPLFHEVSRGSYSGVDIELARKIADEFDVKLKIDNSAGSEKDIINNLTSQKADFALSRLKITPDIKKELCVTKPYFSTPRALLVNKSFVKDGEIKSQLASFSGKVGAFRDPELMAGADKLFPESDRKGFENYDDMVMALISSEVEIVYGCKLDLQYSMRKLETNRKKNLYTISFHSSADSYVIALPRRYRAFVYVFNRVIEKNFFDIDEKKLIFRYGDEL